MSRREKANLKASRSCVQGHVWLGFSLKKMSLVKNNLLSSRPQQLVSLNALFRVQVVKHIHVIWTFFFYVLITRGSLEHVWLQTHSLLFFFSRIAFQWYLFIALSRLCPLTSCLFVSCLTLSKACVLSVSLFVCVCVAVCFAALYALTHRVAGIRCQPQG